MLITRHVLDEDQWDENNIASRTEDLVEDILSIWPTPEGLTPVPRVTQSVSRRVTLKDLITAGVLKPGTRLKVANPTNELKDVIAEVTADGMISLNGKLYDSPSRAGVILTNRKAVSGWEWWTVADTGERLFDVRARFLAG